MTKFSLTGTRNGKRVTVTWEDGDLSSTDPAMVQWIQELARMEEGRPVRLMPAAPTFHDHLADPYSACALIRSVFPDPRTLEMRGKLPTMEVPPGAIV